MVRLFIAVIAMFTLIGCGPKKQPELKSPCVAVDSSQPDSPCAKRPANAWLS